MMDGRAARTRESEDSLPPFLRFRHRLIFLRKVSILFRFAEKVPAAVFSRRIVFRSLAFRPQFSRFLAPNNIWQLFDPISFRSGTTRCKSSRYVCHINNACHSRGFIRLKRSIVLANVYLDRSSAGQRVICCTGVAS